MHVDTADLWLCLAALINALSVGTTGQKRISEEERLLDNLFAEYNPSARPVLNSSNTVVVHIEFSLLQIQELNVVNQILTSTGLLILQWKDERLVWDKEVYGLDKMVINGKKIWKPEFAVINGADGIYEDYSQFQAILHPDGTVRWEPGGIFKTMCQIDITYYPFDDQKCDLQFGAWSYYTSKMNLTTDKVSINLDTFESNGEWDMIKTSVVRKEFKFACCPELFSNVAFSVYIRRRHTFYIMNVILPGILTSAVLLSIFFCTPAQKVHIGVASLLSFRLFLLNVADNIPRTSDHVPLLGIYLTCTMAITTLAMVATVFVLNLYHNTDKPVPIWAKKVFVYYLAKVLCMCSCLFPETPPIGEKEKHKVKVHRAKYTVIHDLIASDSEDSPSLLPLRTRVGTHHDTRSTRDMDSITTASSNITLSPYQSPKHTTLSSDHKNQTDETDAKPDYTKDWKRVAEVFDRLFFWICFLAIVVTTLLLFHPLTTSHLFKPKLPADTHNNHGNR